MCVYAFCTHTYGVCLCLRVSSNVCIVGLYICMCVICMYVCVHIKFCITTSSHFCQGTQMFHVPRTPHWDHLYLCSDPSIPRSCPLATVSLITGILYKYNLFLTNTFYLFYVFGCFAYMYIYVPHVCLIPTEVRRQYWITWN